MRAATAAADPDEEPPGVWAGFHGLRVGPASRKANSVVWVLPRITAPAARSRATEVASVDGRECANGREPAVVGMPWTWKMSFTPIGTPRSAPRAVPASSARAAARAPSPSRCAHAWRVGSRARIFSRHASTTVNAVSSPAWTRAAVSRTPSAAGVDLSVEDIEHLRDHLESTERRHQVRARVAAAHVVDQLLRHLDARAQGRLPRLPHPRADGVRDGDPGHLVVQELRVTGAVQRQDPHQHRHRRAAGAREKALELLGIVDRLCLQPPRPRLDLAMHPVDLAL